MPDLGVATGLRAMRHPTPDEIDPIAGLRQWIVCGKVVVKGPRARAHRGERRPSRGKGAGKLRRRASPDFGEVAQVAEQPAAADANSIRLWRRDVALLGHVRE